jgi:hypothetical protein
MGGQLVFSNECWKPPLSTQKQRWSGEKADVQERRR